MLSDPRHDAAVLVAHDENLLQCASRAAARPLHDKSRKFRTMFYLIIFSAFAQKTPSFYFCFSFVMPEMASLQTQEPSPSRTSPYVL